MTAQFWKYYLGTSALYLPIKKIADYKISKMSKKCQNFSCLFWIKREAGINLTDMFKNGTFLNKFDIHIVSYTLDSLVTHLPCDHMDHLEFGSHYIVVPSKQSYSNTYLVRFIAVRYVSEVWKFMRYQGKCFEHYNKYLLKLKRQHLGRVKIRSFSSLLHFVIASHHFYLVCNKINFVMHQ